MVVDNEIDIRTARWATLAAACKSKRGASPIAPGGDGQAAGLEGASRVVDRAIQIPRQLQRLKDFPFERWYREMRIRRIGEGPSEVQRIVMARELFDQALY